MARPSKRTASKTAELRRLHSTGASSREIAEVLGVSPSTLNGWLRALGLRPNGGHGARRTRERLGAGEREPVGRAVERVASELTAELDAGDLDAPELVRRRQREVAELLAITAEQVRRGEGNAAAYAALSKLEAELAERSHAMRPPTPPDPEQDPLNVAEATKTRQRLERLVTAAEERFKCANCGESPYPKENPR